MARRFVKQPNGRLALFSDIVDNFTYMNMSESEAVAIAMSEFQMSEAEAIVKVNAAITDDVWGDVPKDDGLCRWRNCVDLILQFRGEDDLQDVLLMDEQGDYG